MSGQNLLGPVVVDAGHDRALVGALAEREFIALAFAIILVGDTVVRRELGALVIAAQDEVDDARDRVGTVHRRGTVGQDFDALDHVGRNVVRVAREVTVAVDQRQRTGRAQAAQTNRRETRTAGVVDLRVDVRAGDRRQLLDQITQGQLAGLLDRGAINRDNRIRCLNVDASDVRTCDRNRFEFLAVLILRLILREKNRTGQEAQRGQCSHRSNAGRSLAMLAALPRARRLIEQCVSHEILLRC